MPRVQASRFIIARPRRALLDPTAARQTIEVDHAGVHEHEHEIAELEGRVMCLGRRGHQRALDGRTWNRVCSAERYGPSARVASVLLSVLRIDVS
jgi:hypothetical protein